MKHYSETIQWQLAKAASSRWKVDTDANSHQHLYWQVLPIVTLRRLESLSLEKLHKLIEIFHTKDGSKKINIIFSRITNETNEINDSMRRLNSQHVNLNISYKHSLFHKSSASHTFIINLKEWGSEKLDNNWKRNLAKSRKYESEYRFREIDFHTYIDQIYRLLIASSKYKDYIFPYSKELLSIFSKVTGAGIQTIAAFNSSNEISSFRSYCVINNTAVDFLAATEYQDLKTSISYNICYKLITQASQSGLFSYDLGGVDPLFNKGVYTYKKGLGGVEFSLGKPFIILSSPRYLPKPIGDHIANLCAFLIR